jgi:glycosyltransferase involved in cell wall biosynthesis
MTLSVVIPTSGRPESLLTCLDRLKDATEIIVTDDGAETTQELTQQFSNAKWVRGPRRGPAANRNNGSRYATGDWLAFVDDDCVPDSSWLLEVQRATKDSDVVEGKTICPDQADGLLEEVVENLNGDSLWSCNLAIRRDLFDELNGFDEDFLEPGGEDLEFGWRVKQRRLRVRFAARAVVQHPVRRISLWQAIRRVFQIRWHLLYRLKTTRPAFAFVEEVLDFLRVTAHMRTVSGVTNSQRFHLLLRWLFLPLWVPYLVCWEIIFRSRLRAAARIVS